MRVPEPDGGLALAVPRGRPDELRTAADRLERVAGSCLCVAVVRGTARRDVDLVWTGTAAAAATSELAALSARTRTVLPQLKEGAAVLRAYADELDRAQQAMRRLRVRSEAALDEHARERAAADLHGLDPATREAAIQRADQRRHERLDVVARERVRTMRELGMASARCAMTLQRLTPSAGVGFGAGAGYSLVDGLPLTRELLLQATTPTAPTESEPAWWEDALDDVEDAGRWTWNHVVVPVVNGAADLAEAAVDHPEDLGGMALGIGMVIAGTGGEMGGVALDVTGVGAVAGVPLQVASTALIAGGIATAGAAAVQLGQHAAANDNMLLKEVRLRDGSRGKGGEPLPDSQRPLGAGSAWRGHITNEGNGVVWQRPQDRCPPPKVCTPNSIRINDPTQRYSGGGASRITIDYPHGYVRFFNEGGQALKLDGKPGSHAETHHHLRPDGTYDLPRGWNPQ